MTSSSAEVIDLGPMNSLQGVQAWHIVSRCGQALANASSGKAAGTYVCLGCRPRHSPGGIHQR